MNTQLELRPHYGVSTIATNENKFNNYCENYLNINNMDDYLTEEELDNSYNNHLTEDDEEETLPEIREPDYDDYIEYMYWRNFDATTDIFPCSKEFIRALRHNAEYNNEYSDEYSDEYVEDTTSETTGDEVIIIKPSRVYDYV